GLRRVGKTTAVRYLLSHITHSNTIYLDLEKAENRLLFNQTHCCCRSERNGNTPRFDRADRTSQVYRAFRTTVD
ncbi:MAG: hypothetical protein LH609_13675, partial [Rudanella sp.]|nr:hypothetical protein [Rudanella sp.]